MTSIDEELHAAREEIDRAATALRVLRRASTSSRDVTAERSAEAIEEAKRCLVAARTRLDGALRLASGHVRPAGKE